MNFTEVVAEVLSMTKRPDKLAETRRAVNTCLTKACIGAEFSRDLVEETIAISSSEYVQSVDITTLTRFRIWEYIRPYGAKKPLCPLDGPLAVFDEEGCEKTDCYYLAGSNTVIRLSNLYSSLVVGYYQYPPVLTDASPDFWLLNIQPYMIINGAAAIIFRDIGDDGSARMKEAEYKLEYDSARIDLKYGIRYG